MTKMLYIYSVTCWELIDHIYNTRKAQLAREQYQNKHHVLGPEWNSSWQTKDSGSNHRRSKNIWRNMKKRSQRKPKPHTRDHGGDASDFGMRSISSFIKRHDKWQRTYYSCDTIHSSFGWGGGTLSTQINSAEKELEWSHWRWLKTGLYAAVLKSRITPFPQQAEKNVWLAALCSMSSNNQHRFQQNDFQTR